MAYVIWASPTESPVSPPGSSLPWFFQAVDINTEFWTSDLAVWHNTQSYANTVCRRVEVLLVVNDFWLCPDSPGES